MPVPDTYTRLAVQMLVECEHVRVGENGMRRRRVHCGSGCHTHFAVLRGTTAEQSDQRPPLEVHNGVSSPLKVAVKQPT